MLPVDQNLRVLGGLRGCFSVQTIWSLDFPRRRCHRRRPALQRLTLLSKMREKRWDIHREGRSWGREALARYALAPEKIEMVGGKLLASHDERLTLLALLLENVGVNEAVRLGNPDIWRAAIAALK